MKKVINFSKSICFKVFTFSLFCLLSLAFSQTVQAATIYVKANANRSR